MRVFVWFSPITESQKGWRTMDVVLRETVDSMTVAKSDNALTLARCKRSLPAIRRGFWSDLTGLAGTLSPARLLPHLQAVGVAPSASARWYEVEQEGLTGHSLLYCSEDGRWFRKDRVNMPSPPGVQWVLRPFQFGSGRSLCMCFPVRHRP